MKFQLGRDVVDYIFEPKVGSQKAENSATSAKLRTDCLACFLFRRGQLFPFDAISRRKLVSKSEFEDQVVLYDDVYQSQRRIHPPQKL